MFDYLDAIPEAQFMSLIIALIAVAYLAEWAFRKWTEGGKRGGRPQ